MSAKGSRHGRKVAVKRANTLGRWSVVRGRKVCGGGTGCPLQEDSPRTRFRGSLMLTVWSWEAERELFIERSAVEWEGGYCVTSDSRGVSPVPPSGCLLHEGTEEPESGELGLLSTIRDQSRHSV